MSFHNKPNYQIPELIEALKAHRLPHDTPSQLADSFRIGWMACRELAQAESVPAVDEARRLFDAGWKAAALFCDREDVVADGIIGFGACPQFEAAFSAAHGIKGGQHG